MELIKLFVAYALDAMGMCGSSSDTSRVAAVTSWMNWLKYAGPSACYALQNNLNVYAIVYLTPHFFALFNNFKIVPAAILAKYILKQKFSSVQWVALLLLVT